MGRPLIFLMVLGAAVSLPDLAQAQNQTSKQVQSSSRVRRDSNDHWRNDRDRDWRDRDGRDRDWRDRDWRGRDRDWDKDRDAGRWRNDRWHSHERGRYYRSYDYLGGRPLGRYYIYPYAESYRTYPDTYIYSPPYQVFDYGYDYDPGYTRYPSRYYTEPNRGFGINFYYNRGRDHDDDD